MPFSDSSAWAQTFQELIQEEKPRAKWSLTFDKNIVPDGAAPGWRQQKQRVLGRFQCSICNRRWFSAQVEVLCHMYKEPWESHGKVHMRIFGQRCQKCSRSQFENPEFSTEDVRSILKNLVNYILQKYYGHGSKKTLNVPQGEKVHLDGPHDIGNCEACILGCCRKIPLNTRHSLEQKAKPPKSLSPSPKSHSSLPQTGSNCFENTHFQERREPGDTALPLLMIFSLAAFAFIVQFIK